VTSTPVPAGYLAAIVTSFEMNMRPSLRAMPSSELRLERWQTPMTEKYLMLFRRVGAPWLWTSRLAMGAAQLTAIIHDPDVHIWAVSDRAGIEIGILELDFRIKGACEIAFFGLVPELNGAGHGRWLMAMALQFAWTPKEVKRVWLNSCTLDGPHALGFYVKSGFTPYQRQVEIFHDPRLKDLLPKDAAPQIPLL
jgi:GNAT superfamily N-acetyltransferase